MLLEITIRNFAVIRETRIEFGSGLTALTGETGAGKSIVLDALGAVLGERTSPSVIRSGEDRAYVAAIFALPDTSTARYLLDEMGIETDGEDAVILSRDITHSRSIARINGRTVTARALTELGEFLVDIHGQSDHLSLLRPDAQLDMLDRFASTLPLRERFKEAHDRWLSIRRRIESHESERREQARREDFLRLQLDEIESVAPEPGEDEALEAEQKRLTHAVQLLALTNRVRTALDGSDALEGLGTGAIDQLRSAEASLQEMTGLDDTTEGFLQQLRDSLYGLDELSSDLRDYLNVLEVDPARLDTVNERLQDFRALTRKYGATVDEVLDHASTVRAELDEMLDGAVNIDELLRDQQEVEACLASLAADLSSERSDAGAQLSRQVESTIAELNMGAARFVVGISQREDSEGLPIDGRRFSFDSTGIDDVRFLLATNPGSEAQPLSRVASGGETARLMLALKSILSEADETPTLVFDEIDVGIGGRSGQVVGEKLWTLAHDHQVIVISHLPQVAAFAGSHTTMAKRDDDGVVETTARPLHDAERIDEIAMMFDGKPVSPESRANALALLRRIEGWKSKTSLPTGASTAC